MKKMYLLAVVSALTMLSKGYGVDKMNSNYSYGYQRYGKEIVDSIQGTSSKTSGALEKEISFMPV